MIPYEFHAEPLFQTLQLIGRQTGVAWMVGVGPATPEIDMLTVSIDEPRADRLWYMTNTARVVRLSVAAWTIAVAAGVVETVLAVRQLVDEDRFGAGGLANVAVRAVVFSVAMILVAAFARGSRPARIALTVLLSVIGLGSLVVPAAASLAAGHSIVDSLSDGGRLGWAFAAVRLTHIAAVVVATVLMYTPGANRHVATVRTEPAHTVR
jgi:hypothetical protein